MIGHDGRCSLELETNLREVWGEGPYYAFSVTEKLQSSLGSMQRKPWFRSWVLDRGICKEQTWDDQNVKYVPLKSDYSEIVMKSMEWVLQKHSHITSLYSSRILYILHFITILFCSSCTLTRSQESWGPQSWDLVPGVGMVPGPPSSVSSSLDSSSKLLLHAISS